MSMSDTWRMRLQSKIKDRLLEFVHSPPKMQILVIGDAGLDEYITGEVKRISPEAPVPVLEVSGRSYRIGLAGNVAQNITALGAGAEFVAVIGQDQSGDVLKRLLQEAQVSMAGLCAENQRPTILKTRAMTGPYQLLRIDHELKKYVTAETEKKLWDKCAQLLPTVQAVVVEDYAKGLLTQALYEKLVAECRRQNKPVFVDPARSNPAEFYRGCTLFKPNFDEALQLAGVPREELKENSQQLQTAAKRLSELTAAKHLVITQGKLGMSIFSEGEHTHIPTFARHVYDVTGAGDTVIATIAVGMTGGLSLQEACILANMAAGYVVGQVGSVPCSKENLLQYLQSAPVSNA